MATDGPGPPPCDREILTKGKLVMMTHTITSNAMEAWVRKVAELSGQRVDWHFAGGRACVLALGDEDALDRVRLAIDQMLPEHDRLQTEAVEKMLPGHPFKPSCTTYEDNQINTAYEHVQEINRSRQG